MGALVDRDGRNLTICPTVGGKKIINKNQALFWALDLILNVQS